MLMETSTSLIAISIGLAAMLAGAIISRSLNSFFKNNSQAKTKILFEGKEYEIDAARLDSLIHSVKRR